MPGAKYVFGVASLACNKIAKHGLMLFKFTVTFTAIITLTLNVFNLYKELLNFEIIFQLTMCNVILNF